MEDVLEVYSRPYDEDYPVICMDEKPVQFFSDFRKGFRSKKDGVQYEDYQYIRNGTASISGKTDCSGLGKANRVAVDQAVSYGQEDCSCNG